MPAAWRIKRFLTAMRKVKGTGSGDTNVFAPAEFGFDIGAQSHSAHNTVFNSEGLPVAPLVTTTQSSWAGADNSFWTTPPGRPRLPVGIYRMDISPNVGPTFTSVRNDTDLLVDLPDSESDKVIDEIRTFKKLRPAFQRHGFLYKRGIFLWGPPGSGKTCTVQQILKLLMGEHDSIAVMVDNPHVATQCLLRLRQIEPERQVVAVEEDLDALVDRYDEAPFLSLLDGESQVDNIVHIATSNYPEKLDRRFLDRPSRFDTVRYIGMPTPEARRMYLSVKVPELSEVELHDYVKHTPNYSIAHLRELIVLTRCFNFPLSAAIERLNGQRLKLPNSEKSPDRPPVGFYGTTGQ